MKKAEALGEGLLTVYRLFLVAVVALVVLGASAVFYDYYINVKDVEAGIIARGLISCFSENGLDVDLNECGFDLNDTYIRVEINFGLLENRIIEEGDKGIGWTEEVDVDEKYKLGYFKELYPFFIEGEEIEVEMEVYVNHEF